MSISMRTHTTFPQSLSRKASCSRKTDMLQLLKTIWDVMTDWWKIYMCEKLRNCECKWWSYSDPCWLPSWNLVTISALFFSGEHQFENFFSWNKFGKVMPTCITRNFSILYSNFLLGMCPSFIFKTNLDKSVLLRNLHNLKDVEWFLYFNINN